MRVRNKFGTETEGSIGQKITTARWRGRRYAKAYRKPKNPRSDQQQRKRSHFADAVAMWQSFSSWQKLAYDLYVTARALDVSAYHAMLGSYTATRNAGQTYYPPSGGWFEVVGLYSDLPIEGSLIEVWRDNETELYYSVLSDSSGRAYGGLTAEDQTYTIRITADGYEEYNLSGLLASQLFGSESTIRLVGGQLMRLHEDFVWKDEAEFLVNRWNKEQTGTTGASAIFGDFGVKVVTGNQLNDKRYYRQKYAIMDSTVEPYLIVRCYVSSITDILMTLGAAEVANQLQIGIRTDISGTKYVFYTDDDGWTESDIDLATGWQNWIIQLNADRYPSFYVNQVLVAESSHQFAAVMLKPGVYIRTYASPGSKWCWWNNLQLLDNGVEIIP